MTGAGPLPISFEIEADTLADAVDKFGEAAKEAIERTVRDLQELRRQAASSIVVPQGGGMGGLGPGGLGGGGLGGGGKIQIP
jgi:aspartate aminotransferase-like enzyme